jgi:dihydroorotase
MTDGLRITRPDDWHVHFRDGESLRYVVPDTARRFARAIVMPNLDPPVTRVAQALDYRRRILACIPETVDFTPLMTLYLTDETTAEEVSRARDCEHVYGIKLYPAGATTNSAFGVTDMQRVSSALAAMENAGVPLLVHGEVSDPQIDVFDRERVFIERVLAGLVESFPGLKVVFEHVTTCEAVAFVSEAPENVAATITAHHLRANRNAMFAGGLRPHHYCLPVLKRETHRRALIDAATGGSPKFFLGTDSAPHARSAKETACGCAGVYTAHAAIELYAEIFEGEGALDALDGFASVHGADFYGLPKNESKVTLTKSPWKVPESLAFGDDVLVPFRAGEQLSWSLANQ